MFHSAFSLTGGCEWLWHPRKLNYMWERKGKRQEKYHPHPNTYTLALTHRISRLLWTHAQRVRKCQRVWAIEEWDKHVLAGVKTALRACVCVSFNNQYMHSVLTVLVRATKYHCKLTCEGIITAIIFKLSLDPGFASLNIV